MFYLQGLKLEATEGGRIVFESLVLINNPIKAAADILWLLPISFSRSSLYLYCPPSLCVTKANLSKSGPEVEAFEKLSLKWHSKIQTCSWRYSEPVSTPVNPVYLFTKEPNLSSGLLLVSFTISVLFSFRSAQMLSKLYPCLPAHCPKMSLGSF